MHKKFLIILIIVYLFFFVLPLSSFCNQSKKNEFEEIQKKAFYLLEKEKDPKEAIKYFEKAFNLGKEEGLKKEPLSSLAMHISFIYCNQIGNLEKAESYACKAFELNTNAIDGFISLSYYYLDKKDFEKSLSLLNKVLEKKPDNFKVKLHKGEVLHKKGDIKEAVILFNEVRKSEYSLDRRWRIDMSIAYFDDKQYEAAKDLLKESWEKGKGNRDNFISMYLCEIYLAEEKWDKLLSFADESFQIIMEGYPKKHSKNYMQKNRKQFDYYKGTAYYGKKQYDKAYKLLEPLYKKNVSDPYFSVDENYHKIMLELKKIRSGGSHTDQDNASKDNS